jgi:CheY-like chemotaxis protein/LmbE family N-acetylglucosaminyl deacetylase
MTELEARRCEILLVEDNLTDATVIRSALEKDATIRVTLAQDGIRGCQLAQHQRWDLVITDINLPGRDGIAVIETSRIHQPDTPVLVVSAFLEEHQADTARGAGASDILTKPVEGHLLLDLVQQILRKTVTADFAPRRILAISALAGDAEAGCGGVLVKRSASGDKVTILVLSTGVRECDESPQRTAAVRASRALGAQVILPPSGSGSIPGLDQMVARVQGTAQDLNPDVIVAPSPRDIKESRRNAYQAADSVTPRVPGLVCYQSGTATQEFRPTLFEDISEFLGQKMAALSHYQAQVRGRPHLDPELAKASARYWGRFLGYTDVEPLEVMRQVI